MTAHRACRRLSRLLASMMLAGAVLISLLATALPAATAAMTPAATAAMTPAATAEAAPLVRVVIEAVTPRIPAPGGTLTLTGRIVNGSAETLEGTAVRLRTTSVPLASRSELAMIDASVDTGRLTSADGWPLAQSRVELAAIEPGGERAFSMAVPLDALGLRRFGAYPLTVEVTGDLGRGVRSQARERTFLPWSPTVKEYREVGVSWLWPVLSVPRRTEPAGTFRDDTLAQEIAGSGRLGQLVAVGARAPVTWVVDPDLLESVADMADGYLIAGPQGPVEGTGRDTAAQWLANLRAASADDEVVTVHYADVDVAGLVAAELPGQVRAAAERSANVAARVLGRPVITDVGWLAGGAVDPAALAAQLDVGIRAEVVDGALIPNSAAFTPTGRTTLPAQDRTIAGLVADPELSRLAAGAAPVAPAAPDAPDAPDAPGSRRANPAMAVQRFLAETAMIVAESPGRARSVLVAPPREWDPHPSVLREVLLADAEAPWTAATSLTALRALEPGAKARAERGSSSSHEGTDADVGPGITHLPRPHLTAAAHLQQRAEQVAGLLDDPEPARRAAREVTLRLSSTAWVNRPERADVVGAVRGALDALEARVHIVPGGVTFGGRSGVLPITVVNERDEEVTVRVELNARSGKLDITPAEPITVAPRSSGQVVFRTEARATGIVYLDAQLVTVGGDEYGPSVRKRVSVTQYGTVGVLVTVGAALVLFATATLQVVRRARSARRPNRSTQNPSGPDRSGVTRARRAEPESPVPVDRR